MKKKKDFSDKKAEVLANKFEEYYDEYLAQSENKRTTALREDTFIHGILAGMKLSARAGELLEEMEK
jgi:hypothetical protein